jgi:L-malate glycosyltransferase
VTMLRVLHLIDSLIAGGTERQCLALVRGLVARGIDNAVFHLRDGDLRPEFLQAGATVAPIAFGGLRSRRAAFDLFGLARRIREWRPDVVQTYGFYSNLPGVLAGALARVNVRVASRRELALYLTPMQRRADRWAWRLSHRVVANSNAVRDHLAADGLSRSKIVVIRNGLDLQPWAAEPSDHQRNGAAIVGMVAHFREQKDHTTFIRAARQISAAIPAVRFQLFGSGPLEAQTRELAQREGIGHQVEFCGHLDGPALRSALRHLHVSVLTSEGNEGLPNAVIESMAARLPVVATAVGGSSELIEDGVSGFLVPPKDPAAVARKVVQLLKEPGMSHGMGERGREKVERELTAELMVERFHALYRDLIRERSAGNS